MHVLRIIKTCNVDFVFTYLMVFFGNVPVYLWSEINETPLYKRSCLGPEVWEIGMTKDDVDVLYL